MSDTLLQEVLSCPTLPSLPAVAVQLLELTSDPDVIMSDIAMLVQQDQALSAKVLKTVNSSFYGLSTPCGSIDRAMGYLGLNTVKSLVLGFSLVETTKAVEEGFDLDAHWRRAIIGATGSRVIAKRIGRVDPEEAFTAALFQDMGMLAAFAALESQYVEVIDGIDHRVVCKTESEEFGFDHAEIGHRLASKWKLPEEICEAIRCHHDLDHVKAAHLPLAQVVSLGAVICDTMNEKTTKSAIRKFERVAQEWYGDNAPDIETLIDEVAETSKTLAKMFEQDIGDLPSAAEMMARAQEQGIEHQVSLQREADEMAREAHIDGLTRVANRKHFDGELERVYSDFASNTTEFGVLFFDADKFKLVNDTYGHAAGDAVLIELAKRTSDVVGDAGLVCRYGGEEFAVIVPGVTLDECAALGERVRAIIADSPFDLSALEGVPDELTVTVSVGVSTSHAGSQTRLSSADQVVQEADECVYAAKEDGRNNVKVWGRYTKSEKSAEPTSAPESAPAPSSMPEPEAPAASVSMRTKKAKNAGRILFIEDDALAATLVISLIKRRSKVDIQWVKNGTKACILIDSGKYAGDEALDLIICDFNLPGCNGHEVLRVAKSSATVADVPFFLLTSSTDVDIREETLRRGATKFVHKDEFCANVNKWVDEVLHPVKLAA